MRNRVKRRLRHAAADHLAETPPSTHVVVRALPRAADADWATLRAELAGAWQRAMNLTRQQSGAGGNAVIRS